MIIDENKLNEKQINKKDIKKQKRITKNDE